MEAQHEPYMAFIKQEMGQTKSAIDSVEAEIHQDECTKAVRNLQDSLRRFTCTPWFKRTWIRQEVFAAKSIWIYFEDFKMQFDFQNKKFWQWLRCDPASLLDGPRAPKKPQQHRHPRPPRPELAPQFLIMASHFRHHGTDNKDYTPPQVKISHGLHWLRTLQEGTGFQVTDPRDRVYALLGIIASPSTRFWVAPAKHGTVMTNGTTPKDFPVDYERSISMVYQDVVKYLINVERNLDSLCTFQDRRRHNSDVPSWALDWRDDSARTFIESSQDLAELEQVLGQPPLQDLNEFSVLHVSGFQASKIFSLHGGSPDSNSVGKSWFWWTFGQEAVNTGTDIPRCREYYVAFNRDVVYHVQLNHSLDFPGSIDFLVPRDSILDDEIVFAKGARTPLVLRRMGKGKHRFIGPVMMIITSDLAKSSPEFLASSVLRWSADTKTAYPNWADNAQGLRTYILV